MSTSATEQGTQGQEPGTQQGQEGSQGQEPGTQQTQGQEPGSQQQDTGTDQAPDFSSIQDPAVRAHLERLDKDAREARAEAARYRTERNTARQQATEAQRANETAEQTAQREAQEAQERTERLERENRDLKIGGALRDAATAAKAHNPQRVVDLLTAKVELDDEGKPTNVQDLLKDLRKSDPYLFKRAQQDGGEGNDGDAAPSGDMNSVIRSQVAARRGRS